MAPPILNLLAVDSITSYITIYTSYIFYEIYK